MGSSALAQSGVLDLRQAVRDAGTDRTVLLVASHPDDRWVLPAALLRLGHGVRVSVALATRGEGGQNSEGPESGDALGRLRTVEAEACAARLGTDVWYLNRPDAGYSRTAEEALSQWGKADTIEVLATVIRAVSPDVVLTAHHSAERHGHDLALLRVLPDAVAMAIDPGFVPDERRLVGLPVTRVAKPCAAPSLYVALPPAERGRADTILNFEAVEPDRGLSYRQIAYEALTEEHASQRPFAVMEELFDGEMPLREHGTAVGSGPVPPADAVNRLFAGQPDFWTDCGWPDATIRTLQGRLEAMVRLAPTPDLSPIARRAAEAELLKETLAASRMVRSLEAAEPSRWRLPSSGGDDLQLRFARRVQALQDCIRTAARLRLQVELDPPGWVVPGEEFPITVHLHNDGSAEIGEFSCVGVDGLGIVLSVPRDVEDDDESDSDVEGAKGDGVKVADAAPDFGALNLLPSADQTYDAVVSIPVPPIRRRVVPKQRPLRTPLPPSFTCSCVVGDQALAFKVGLQLSVRPPVGLHCVPQRLLLPEGRDAVAFTVMVQNHSRFPIDKSLRVDGGAGFVVEGGLSRQVLLEPLGSAAFDFRVYVPEGIGRGVRRIQVWLGDQRLALPLHTVAVQMRPNLRVGLVRGVDESALRVLEQLVPDLEVLDDLTLERRQFDLFDTIVIDVRALRGRPALQDSLPDLLAFARESGKRLVVFYHKHTEINAAVTGVFAAPRAPFEIGTGRVTREDAPVRVLLPEHPLLNVPNRIRAQDWDGWQQERGLYFPGTIAPEYELLVSMNDPGEPPQNTSLVHLPIGDGSFVYCALALFRQLENLHPGGVRLFANLMHPSTPE